MLYLTNRKYEQISFNYFLLQVIPCRSQRKQQMHPKQVFISLLACSKETQNSVLFGFFNTSLFRQKFLLREFEVLYKQAGIIISTCKIRK